MPEAYEVAGAGPLAFVRRQAIEFPVAAHFELRPFVHDGLWVVLPSRELRAPVLAGGVQLRLGLAALLLLAGTEPALASLGVSLETVQLLAFALGDGPPQVLPVLARVQNLVHGSLPVGDQLESDSQRPHLVVEGRPKHPSIPGVEQEAPHQVEACSVREVQARKLTQRGEVHHDDRLDGDDARVDRVDENLAIGVRDLEAALLRPAM